MKHLSKTLLVACMGAGLAYASPLDRAVSTSKEATNAAAASQKKIDGYVQKRNEMYETYRGVIAEHDTLKAYNDQVATMIHSQEEEMHSLKEQIAEIENTHRKVLPLIRKMTGNLERFIGLDVPFLPKERRARVEKLKEELDRADITVSEKYRLVLEAYQIENDYGRTIEAYRSDLKGNGGVRVVDFLRLGRTALYYQTLDGSESGVWDKKTGAWRVLDEQYKRAIKQGLRIARKQAAPDLLTLPISPAVAAN